MCDCIHINTNAFYLSIQSAIVFTAVHLKGREMFVHVFVCESMAKVWEEASVVYFTRHGIYLSVLVLLIHSGHMCMAYMCVSRVCLPAVHIIPFSTHTKENLKLSFSVKTNYCQMLISLL